MSAKKVQQKEWPAKPISPPKLSNTRWALSSVLGVVLLAMALLQLISFGDFRDVLDTSGLAAPTAWAVLIIVAELWGAAGFFKLPLSYLFRQISYVLAVFAAIFWFIYNIQLVSGSSSFNPVANSGFFGRFLAQKPGWWTVIEVTILLFVVLYMVEELRNNRVTAAAKRR